MNKQIFGFIGLGLIGGSIAKSIKRVYGDSSYIIAYDINNDTLQTSFTEGTIDESVHQIDERFSGCSFLFLCAPVSFNNENLTLLKQFISDGCILTDVGSVKSGIHEVIHKSGLDHCFIGGHPMAGSEKTGYHNSTDRLIENAFYVLTPTKTVPADYFEKYYKLISSIGAIPLRLDSAEHDYVVAAISHLPHIIAASLVNLVEHSDNDSNIMKIIAAGGFKDITRIASSSSEMWKQITLANKVNISKLLHDYIHSLIDVLDSIHESDDEKLYDFFANAKEYRDTLGDASPGPIKKVPFIYVDIPDKTGIIAAIATILADNKISIKNIGIVHNREFEEGALRIEFYDDLSSVQSESILNQSGYSVFNQEKK